MKRLALMIVSALIFGVLTSCDNENEAEKGLQIIEFECVYEVDNLAKELLVFILQDYFELATETRGERCVQVCKIESKQLKTTLETLNIVSISKAFPDLPEEPAIVYNEYGQQVQQPEINQLFKFLFISEQDADEAIVKLNALSEVIYAEKNGGAAPN